MDISVGHLVNFGREIFPQNALVHLPYFEYPTLTTTLAGVTYVEYDWRLNSLFDPNYTETGHQPRGFDQLSSLFTQYLVLGVGYDIELVYNSDGDSSGIAMNLFSGLLCAPGTYETQFASVNDFMEAPMTKYFKRRQHFLVGTAPSSSNSQFVGVGGKKHSMRYTGYINVRNMLKYWGTQNTSGTAAATYLDWPGAYIGATNGNPTNTSFMTFCLGSMAQGTGTSQATETNVLGTCYLAVRLRYDAIMLGAVLPSNS